MPPAFRPFELGGGGGFVGPASNDASLGRRPGHQSSLHVSAKSLTRTSEEEHNHNNTNTTSSTTTNNTTNNTNNKHNHTTKKSYGQTPLAALAARLKKGRTGLRALAARRAGPPAVPVLIVNTNTNTNTNTKTKTKTETKTNN